MYTSYKSRIYPTQHQENLLAQSFGAHRYVYNWALNLKKENYKKGYQLSYKELFNRVNSELIENAPWLKKVCPEIIDNSILNLKQAFRMVSKGEARIPKFKTRENAQSIQFKNSFKLYADRNELLLPNIGLLKIETRLHILGDVCFLTVSRTSSGKYFVVFNTIDGKEYPESPSIKAEESIGIDVGIHNLAICSNGRIFRNPEFYAQALPKLNRLRDRLERMVPESNHYKIAKIKLLKEKEAIRNRRNDYFHNVVNELVQNPDVSTIFIEKLNIKKMMSDPFIKAKLSDACLYDFLELLKVQGKRNGVNVLEIDEFFPSTQKCNHCGHLNKRLTLGDRFWTCPECHEVIDRDLNAAVNIRERGLEQYAPCEK